MTSDRNIFADLISFRKPRRKPRAKFEIYVQYTSGSMSGFDTKGNCLAEFNSVVNEIKSGKRTDVTEVLVERTCGCDAATIAQFNVKDACPDWRPTQSS